MKACLSARLQLLFEFVHELLCGRESFQLGIVYKPHARFRTGNTFNERNKVNALPLDVSINSIGRLVELKKIILFLRG